MGLICMQGPHERDMKSIRQFCGTAPAVTTENSISGRAFMGFAPKRGGETREKGTAVRDLGRCRQSAADRKKWRRRRTKWDWRPARKAAQTRHAERAPIRPPCLNL